MSSEQELAETPQPPERERFEAIAANWESGGRNPTLLAESGWGLLALRCWVHSDGAKRQGFSPLLSAYYEASKAAADAAFPGWYDDVLDEKDYCSGGCGYDFHVENLALCSRCMVTCCHGCLGDHQQRGPNGNFLHHCGGEFVG